METMRILLVFVIISTISCCDSSTGSEKEGARGVAGGGGDQEGEQKTRPKNDEIIESIVENAASMSGLFMKETNKQSDKNDGNSCNKHTTTKFVNIKDNLVDDKTNMAQDDEDEDDENDEFPLDVYGPKFQKVHLALPRRESMELGIEEELHVNHRTMKVKQLSEYPPIFEISNFLSENETELIIELAEKKGMTHQKPPPHVDVSFPSKMTQAKFDEWDVDFDGMISMDEFQESSDVDALMIPREEIKDIVNITNIDKDTNGYLTLAELRDGGLVALQTHFNEREKKRSVSRRKGVEETWLWHDEDELLSYENLLEDYHERIKEVTGVPTQIIEHSEPIQVQKRAPGSFSHCQYDSPNIIKGAKCCVYGGKDCQMCRYASLHIFLNEPDGGGELFFPLADDEGDITAEYVKEEVMQRCEPTPNKTCTSSLLIRPARGTAVVWYNHHVARHTGWMGHMDAQSIVGITQVLGTKPLLTAKMWIDIIGDGVNELRPWRFGTNWLSKNNKRDDVIDAMRNDYFQEGIEYSHEYRKTYKRDKDNDELMPGNRNMNENISYSKRTNRNIKREKFEKVRKDIIKNTPTEPIPPEGVKNLNIAKEAEDVRAPNEHQSGNGGGAGAGDGVGDSSQSRYMKASLLLMQELSRSELETLARSLYDKLQYQCVPIIVSPLGHESPL